MEPVIPEIDRFPRAPLAHLPTALEPALRLGASLGVALWVKRDDCTGLALGGNKVRQLEFYLGEAQAQTADTLLVTGAVQSNFVRLAAAAAARAGMAAHVQLEERVDGVDDVYRRSGNVLLDRLLGATVHHFPVGEDEAAADRALQTLAGRLRAEGRLPYVIHLGVEHPPLGALGYVVAAAEIAAQARARGIRFDAVVCGSGSGLTHAGLLAGFRALGMGVAVHGVCVRRDASAQHARIRRRVSDLCSLLGRPGLVADTDVLITDASLAPGYGKLNAATLDAMDRAARLEGLLLDPVYTAKVLAGLVALVASGEIAPASRVVFVHTGGQPGLFAYQRVLDAHLGG